MAEMISLTSRRIDVFGNGMNLVAFEKAVPREVPDSFVNPLIAQGIGVVDGQTKATLAALQRSSETVATPVVDSDETDLTGDGDSEDESLDDDAPTQLEPEAETGTSDETETETETETEAETEAEAEAEAETKAEVVEFDKAKVMAIAEKLQEIEAENDPANMTTENMVRVKVLEQRLGFDTTKEEREAALELIG